MENTEATFEINPPTSDELLSRWQSHLQMPFIVASHEQNIIGFAYVGPYKQRQAYQFTVEDSVYVHPDYIGKAIGLTLLEQLLVECQQKGFKQVVARIAIWQGSEASIKLHEKLGFTNRGCLLNVGYKFGKFIDTVFMQKSLT